jgi:hypothetical protein
MSKVDWLNIIKLLEFNQYLSNTEISQLSTVSKNFRKSLYSTVLKNFNFNDYLRKNCYSSCLISEEIDNNRNIIYRLTNVYESLIGDLLESKNRFKTELYETGYYFNRMIVKHTKDYYYLFSEIPSLFKNVKSLAINQSIIMLDSLKFLLDSLTCLEELELVENKLYKSIQDLNGSLINWPTALKKLKTGSNMIGYVDKGAESIVLRASSQPIGDFVRLSLLPINIPNLHSLYYRSSFYDDEDDGDDAQNCRELIEFLKVNQNIVKLYIGDSNINLALIDTICSLKNLKHLELPSLERFLFSSIDYFNSRVHDNLTSLELALYEDLYFLGKLSLQFPNLTDLALGTMKLQSNLLTEVSKFKNLKNFKIHVYLTFTEVQELTFKNFLKLESFELMSNSINYYESIKWKLDSCLKLKLIKITLFDNYEVFDNSKLIPELKENWKLVHFDDKLSFYKIK